LTESPKPPLRPGPLPASAPDATKAPVTTPSKQDSALPQPQKSLGPPPKPVRGAPKPAPASDIALPPAPAQPAPSPVTAAPARTGTGTAPLPAAAVSRPQAAPTNAANPPLTREPARDTLAPSSFGVIGVSKPAIANAPAPMRAARAPLPTLGDLEGATATATLRPPGAVPPPPRALPMGTPSLDSAGLDRDLAFETPLPGGVGGDRPFTPLAGDLPISPRAPQARADPARTPDNAKLPSHAAPTPATSQPAGAGTLDSTLDVSGSVSKKATQAALLEQSRRSDAGPAAVAAPPAADPTVPAPGLFIADEPLEPRPKLPSLVTAQRELLTRMRLVVLVLGGLLLMAAGALVVMVFRRSEASTARALAPSASAVPVAPGCAVAAPPSRISPIERAVPISTRGLADGSIALAIADTKTSVAGWIYDPIRGEPQRKLDAPADDGEVSHVTAAEPLQVDRAMPDFAFGQTLAPGLALGVGPAGLLRRGDDGATGVVWPLGAGVRVTPPRVVSSASGHFVAFRQGGAEGEIVAGWLRRDGTPTGGAVAIEGAPRSLGTPNVSLLGDQGLVLFSARADKSQPYRVYAAVAAPGKPPSPVRALELPSEGGGAIAPSLAALPGDRYLVQWTDGNIGHYQVHVRIFDRAFQPLGDALLVSGKGANAGQGTIVTTAKAIVSFFIQTTAGHDELWGATLSCH
jgi:hypothetical protein